MIRQVKEETDEIMCPLGKSSPYHSNVLLVVSYNECLRMQIRSKGIGRV